jgi:hypothetical protein
MYSCLLSLSAMDAHLHIYPGPVLASPGPVFRTSFLLRYSGFLGLNPRALPSPTSVHNSKLRVPIKIQSKAQFAIKYMTLCLWERSSRSEKRHSTVPRMGFHPDMLDLIQQSLAAQKIHLHSKDCNLGTKPDEQVSPDSDRNSLPRSPPLLLYETPQPPAPLPLPFSQNVYKMLRQQTLHGL